MEMAAHTLVGGEVAGDLEKLYTQEHGDPGKLEGRPDGEHDSKGILIENLAQVV